jgi:hypothetical protein
MQVSTACGSGRVLLRAKTRPLPQAVLTYFLLTGMCQRPGSDAFIRVLDFEKIEIY